MNNLLTSRSAVLTYQVCPRKRYLQYHAEGTGFSSGKLISSLFIGTIVHRGLQDLLEHCLNEHNGGEIAVEEKCIDDAIEVARKEFYETLTNSNGIAQRMGDNTPYEFVVEESWSLCEALIRGYAMWRLPQFFESYEVLEVEKEEVWEDFAPNVTFLGKADGLLRGKFDNKLYVLSYKTASEFWPVTMRNILHDMQGMSEIALIERRLNIKFREFIQWWNSNEFEIRKNTVYEWGAKLDLSRQTVNYFNYCLDNGIKEIKCYAVQYEFLLKGQHKQDPSGSGWYKYQSYLIHPYKFEGIKNIFTKDVSKIDYKWRMGKGRTPSGWEKINIWEDVGVKTWITSLVMGSIQSEEGDAFQNIFISPEPVIRSESDVKEWEISIAYQESQIAEALDELHNISSNLVGISIENVEDWGVDIYNKKLAQYFPKNTANCHNFYQSDCMFVSICHENRELAELVQIGQFIPRKPHHALETEAFISKELEKW